MRGKTPTLHCDAEDGFCGTWDVDYYTATVDAVNGIKITGEARAPGWSVTADGDDLCPNHTRATTPAPTPAPTPTSAAVVAEEDQ